MNTPLYFAIRGLAAVMTAGLASLAQAGDGIDGPTREEVNALVLQARAAHELRPAGEAVEPITTTSRSPGRTREEVRSEVLEARATGRLVAAGEASQPDAPVWASTLARSDVKNETLLARKRGELIAAGEGFGPVDRAAQPAARRAVLAASVRR